jgi:hypothetical protein
VGATNTANETITNNTQTAIAFNTERWDFDNMHDNTIDTSRLVATQGTGSVAPYVVTVSVQFAGNATGIRSVSLRRNGSTVIASDSRNANSAGPTEITLTTIAMLGDNSYVEAVVNQTSGGDLDILQANELSPDFSMSMLPGGSD